MKYDDPEYKILQREHGKKAWLSRVKKCGGEQLACDSMKKQVEAFWSGEKKRRNRTFFRI
jgi:hypothetical protein